eukprot:CAMPEP_0201559300 /NCGR_PEP_ID=MMETSP0173_2-20130828/73142_1 /ASSEMBLY_ACC=CAM_ASM_000268 /TAXON_ID=218659 /ORGANISM="Vexillifera sp., Strain DIVA3 564/2" /LENGTH=213 /DNA_ID=CAMNT_0047973215 /DNA_START=381 /DNA_END=1019 /DNA_ORIENTATION=-
MTTLETIQYCMHTIRFEKDKLLPMVHVLWQPLISRLKKTSAARSEDVFAALRVIEVIKTCALYCRDFVASKFKRDFWPMIKQWMKRESRENLSHVRMRYQHANDKRSFRYSTECKLQCAILQCIGIMCDAQNMPIKPVAREVLVYLDEQQPKPLQKEALVVFRRLIQTNPDLLWLDCMLLANQNPPTIEIQTDDMLAPIDHTLWQVQLLNGKH